MSKAVLISTQPKWCELIASGKKTIEVRKTRPKIEIPFKCYIYQTKRTWIYDIYSRIADWQGKIIGEFVCDNIFPMSITYSDPNNRLATREFPYTCLTDKQIIDYLGNGKRGYGWHISDLVVYDEPKDIGEFYKGGMLSYDDWLYGIYNGNGGARSSYESYKNAFKLSKAPQSWCYVEEVMDERKG